VGVPGEPPRVDLFSDGEGTWTGPDGRVMPHLEGCEYVDIAETPFTNTLPIRRLGLAPGGPLERQHVFRAREGQPVMISAPSVRASISHPSQLRKTLIAPS
jgi:hypothetical protein